ncbi:hypothetical protein [Mycobacteroides immunogenum]|uniref:DUF3298 domain-containing protein n=1 Tax=Mycobacteroides immunogenum TaxID=83262 RepID=A0A0N1CG14_9MYCO|nr:hypothetical protein [Mycobacteroides immunogenum]AMT70419.1 hypothetical protein ABG82_08845 [Mycobacteroides immunogenum]ANO03486.1 hypothetical protein BAB75_08905 [Mycobacteroides immunogenum]KIU42049.1 hypothetical protein TL11_02745 [Mycobacteroides immunogenum]KPG13506.1 hypothetical protein AN909_04175 [Mycobacteroides immunogenum]KPG14575.1 hypothetical protein AN908_08690 [Mycobacteroides immunogenum]
MTVRGGAAAVAVVMCVIVAGCGRSADQTDQTATAPESTTGPASSSSAVNPGPAEPAPGTAPPAFGFVPELAEAKGMEGTVTYDVHLPQLSGGADAVRDRFNAGTRAALRDLIENLPGPNKDLTASINDGDVGPGPETTRVAVIGPHVVGGIQVYLWYAGGAAHPNVTVSTTVINSDTAQPITYDDLFPNQYSAMERLRQVLPGLDPSGRVRPDTVNVRLEQWLPAPTGLRFYVPVSHAAGDFVPITVPWDGIRDLVDPKIVPVLSP